MRRVIVIGGGAAGLMAAISAAKTGAEVTVLEKNKRLGKKLLITGKGRCNVTNIADLQEFVKNIPGNGKFLYSVFNKFFNWDIRSFFEEAGVALKEERGGRVFPESDRAADIVDALERSMRELAVRVKYDCTVKGIEVVNGKVVGVVVEGGAVFSADAVILATGGASYPATGSNGEGAKMARLLGHNIVPLTPALVPLESDDEWVKELQGLSLRNVEVSKFVDNKLIDTQFGEMMFTHFGVTGPVVLTLSRDVAKAVQAKQEVCLRINLKPALTKEQLDRRIQRDFEKYSRKQIKNALNDLLPAKLIPVIIDLSFIDEDKFINQISREERERLGELLQNLEVHIAHTRSINEAIVTAGGISTKEINPKTMESKLVEGLYCVGEVIDIDGYTGGYNLQAAFSMGWVAGENAAIKND